MKKILAMLLSAAMVLSFAACGSSAPAEEPAAEGDQTTTEAPAEETKEETASSEDGKYELALITDVGTIDDKSFNQGSWEGLKKYAEENNISHKYYKPAEQTTDAYLSAIELAVAGGAKLVVCPGYLFEPAVFQAQDLHPDVKFVLVDGYPNDGAGNEKTAENTYAIKYSEQQVGYLAGYAAVKDGYRNLGFMGGIAVPAVIRYGYGYVQGADAAAKELGLNQGDVTIKYKYLGGFNPAPEYQTEAAAWYQSGTEVIFASAGGAGNSVMTAAESAAGKVIGVDVDQSGESDTVISSAMKELGNSVYDAVAAYYDGTFQGGQNVTLGAAENCVGLPMATSKWQNFTEEEYNALLEKLANDTDGVASNLATDATAENVTDVPVELVSIEFVE